MMTDNIHFTGYDARPLNSIILRNVGLGRRFEQIVKEVSLIGESNNFGVFVQNPDSLIKGNAFSHLRENSFPNESFFAWAQDNLTFTPNGQMLGNYLLDGFNKVVSTFFKRPVKNVSNHIQGGNFFFIKEQSGKNSLLVGENELNFHRKNDLKKEFNVNKIYSISQPDFHIDLIVRPLKNKTVLVNDDQMTLNAVEMAIARAKKYCKTHKDLKVKETQYLLEDLLDDFHYARVQDEYRNCPDISKQLKNQGFNVVKVPGRVLRDFHKSDYNSENHYLANFMNAIVHEKEDGSLVYITNKSLLDDMMKITPEIEQKIDFSFEKLFKESVKEFIKPENIHFVNGDGCVHKFLEYSQGGVHCLFAEVPLIK